MVCNARFVGKMRRIFRPVGDLVDILKRAENNMPDAGLNGGIRQLSAERGLDCLGRGDRRRHQKCAIRAFEGGDEVLLTAKFERDGYDFSAAFLQAQSFRRILFPG